MTSMQSAAAIVFGCLSHGRWDKCEIFKTWVLGFTFITSFRFRIIFTANWWHVYGHSLGKDVS